MLLAGAGGVCINRAYSWAWACGPGGAVRTGAGASDHYQDDGEAADLQTPCRTRIAARGRDTATAEETDQRRI